MHVSIWTCLRCWDVFITSQYKIFLYHTNLNYPHNEMKLNKPLYDLQFLEARKSVNSLN